MAQRHRFTPLALLPLLHTLPQPTDAQVKSCPADLPLSCHNTSTVSNTCCFNAPGGQLLQTQFWDFNPATGPADSWTVHGLWPDNCDGTYQANCDSKRDYTDIGGILQKAGKTELLDFMNEYWKDYQGDDESFWEHEWSKHGTCISSFDPTCYTSYTPQEEVPDFFQKTVDLFKSRDSYSALKSAGIVPDASKKYARDDVAAALAKIHDGKQVTLDCDDSGAINQIWYQFNVKGSAVDGEYVPSDPVGEGGTCPDQVSYPPKSGGGGGGGANSTSTPTGGSPGSQPTSPGGGSGNGTPFTGKGYLDVLVTSNNNKQTGCLISDGSWYATGTCATFTASGGSGGFTLSSSKGGCSVAEGGAFSCGPGGGKDAGEGSSMGTTFHAQGQQLVFGGAEGWSADSVPSGSGRVGVTPGGAGKVGVEIVWKGL